MSMLVLLERLLSFAHTERWVVQGRDCVTEEESILGKGSRGPRLKQVDLTVIALSPVRGRQFEQFLQSLARNWKGR